MKYNDTIMTIYNDTMKYNDIIDYHVGPSEVSTGHILL